MINSQLLRSKILFANFFLTPNKPSAVLLSLAINLVTITFSIPFRHISDATSYFVATFSNSTFPRSHPYVV